MAAPRRFANILRTGIFPPLKRQWLGPAIVALGLAVTTAIVAMAVMASGLIAFPASREDPVGLAGFVHQSFRASARRHSRDIAVPADLDAPWRVQLGAAQFARSCAACHGEPGRGQSPLALSMRPRPQYLPAVLGAFDARSLFWIVRNGAKFTAMPAWPQRDRGDEVWSMVAFLRQMPHMDAVRYAGLASGVEAGTAIVAANPRTPYAVLDANEGPREEFSYTVPAAAFRSGAGDCTACHGEDGAGRADGMAPNLTLQSPTYLAEALGSFASGARPSAIMQQVAVSLTPQDIERLAARYGDRRIAPPGGTVPGDALGARIASEGVPARGVAACSSCHGIEGASPAGFPRLAGQNPIFLAQQMQLFDAGVRGKTVGYDPMAAITHRLTPAERAAVVRHYASLPAGARD